MTPTVTEMREVSIAVASISAVDATVAAIFDSPGYEIQSEPDQPIAARFKSFPVGDRSIAFMEPIGSDATISKFLARRNGAGGLFSASFATGDIEAACDRLARAGARVVLDKPMTLRDLRSGSTHWDAIRVNFAALAGPMRGLVIELQELHGGTPAEVTPGSDAPASLNEVHFACHDIDAAASWLEEALGLEIGPVVKQDQPPEEVRFRNVYTGGKPMLALIAPATPTSTINRFLDRRGPGMFALSASVSDCGKFTARARQHEIRMLFDEPKIAHQTYVGPVRIDSARINWVRPSRASGDTLFEMQEFSQ